MRLLKKKRVMSISKRFYGREETALDKEKTLPYLFLTIARYVY